MSSKPVLQAFLLADDVYQGVGHRKFCIAGTFNMITAQRFPSLFHKQVKIYINLSDVHFDTKINLKYLDLDNSEILFDIKDLPVKKSHNNRNVEVIVELPPIPMPHSGTYHLELWVGEELLSILKIYVEEQQQQNPNFPPNFPPNNPPNFPPQNPGFPPNNLPPNFPNQ